MVNFVSIVLPILISVFLILFFRRRDKRNTQLQTLKNFINTSVSNLNRLFQEKEKELRDKTISLDIALKKLDKASAFINNKMGEIGGSIKQITAIRQALTGELREAADFNRNMAEVRTKLLEISKAATEVDALKKEIADAQKDARQIQSDIDQSKVWAEDNIHDAMKKTLDDIALQKSESAEQIRALQEDISKKQAAVDSLQNKITAHSGALQDMNARLGKFIKDVTDKFKSELASVKAGAGNEAEKFIASVAKKEESLQTMIQKLQGDLSQAVDDIKTVGRESLDAVVRKIQDKEKALEDSLDDAQEKMDNIRDIIGKKFDQTTKELMEKEEYGIENLRNTIRATVEKVKESALGEIDELKTGLSDLKKDLTDETRRMKELENAIASQEKSLSASIAAGEKSLASAAAAREKELESAMAAREKELEKFYKTHTGRLEDLEEEFRKIAARAASESEERLNEELSEFQEKFSKEFEKYVAASAAEYESVAGKIRELTRQFKQIEEEAAASIQDRAASLDTEFTKRVNEITNNFDGYVKKTEEELENTLDNAKADLQAIQRDVAAEKKELKEQVLSDLKDLNKRTKEIETRYDGLVKKSAILDKAETLTEKSGKNVKMITQFLKELEDRKKDIEKAMKSLDTVKTEHKALDGLLLNIAASRKETLAIHETAKAALDKVKDAQEILSIIDKQSGKVEDVKAVLLETLKIYEEIKERIADAEKKRDIINSLINSVDSSRDDIKVMDEKVALIEEKVTTMNKISRKVEEDVKTAQSNISRLFSDQDRIGVAVDKIADIENLLIHIDEESKKVQKMREWVAKLETQLERVRETQEGQLGPKRTAAAERANDEDTAKNILRLKEQGWTVEDISKSLKLSRAYVELVIERFEE